MALLSFVDSTPRAYTGSGWATPTFLFQQWAGHPPGAVDGPVYVTPASVHFQIPLVHVPVAARLAAPAPPQRLSQSGGEFGLPLANRLVAEHHARRANISGRSRKESL